MWFEKRLSKVRSVVISVFAHKLFGRTAPLVLCALFASICAHAAPSEEGRLPTITNAADIRLLSPDQAAMGFPVKIRGVITGDVPAPDFIVQDNTAGIYVEGSTAPSYKHVLGDLVEITGISGPGKFAPVIREKSVRVIGKGKLPDSRVYAFNEFASGQKDSQWMKVRGIVRSASIDRTSWHEMVLAMKVASGGGEFMVRVPITHEQDVSSYIDSEILIEGVCGSLFNQDRQLTGVLFYVPRLSFIRIEATAKEVPLSSLMKFSAIQNEHHRVRLRGVVAHQQPGTALFIQDQGKGLRVYSHQDTSLKTGDIVDVLGFPSMGDSAPVLLDAVFHRLGHQGPPPPVPFDVSRPWETFDGALVTISAKLLDRRQQSEGLRLLLQQLGDGPLFDATLEPGQRVDGLDALPINSEVRITGICLVRGGGLWATPQSFRVLLRSTGDVTVLRAPPFWNLRRTLYLLGLSVGALVLVSVWVFVLVRRLRQQREMANQRLKASAVLEERNRIARELHDSLEQELAGITMQLDLAADCFEQVPRVAKESLETARKMSRRSMVEARRSVWDLRCHLLESGDLVSALKQVIEPLAKHHRVEINVNISGTPVRLASAVEMNLLRIGQEAVSNAVKHGRAQNVSLEVQYETENVRLSVVDDGEGFYPAESISSGHFGLLDMRERASSMGSELVVDSEPGRGTRISVQVPIVPAVSDDASLKANTYPGR